AQGVLGPTEGGQVGLELAHLRPHDLGAVDDGLLNGGLDLAAEAKALGLKVDEGDGHCDVALSMGPARAEVLASGRADAKAGRLSFARLLPKGRRPEQTRRGHFALPVATKGPLGKARKPA